MVILLLIAALLIIPGWIFAQLKSPVHHDIIELMDQMLKVTPQIGKSEKALFKKMKPLSFEFFES